jgi:hypothetical protein
MVSKSLKLYFACQLCTVWMLNFKENDKVSELHEVKLGSVQIPEFRFGKRLI